MKIQLLSDLHFEHFGYIDPIETIEISRHADVVIFAGDISSGTNAIKSLGPLAKPSRPFILINGNHEYYRGDIHKISEGCADAAESFSDFYFLNPGHIDIDGVLFAGATLWTDGRLVQEGISSEVSDHDCQNQLNDFRLISAGDQRFTFKKSNEIHRNELAFLVRTLDESASSRKVVISHHLPSRKSIDPKYANSTINAAFASDLADELINKADLWVHGHTHSSADYVIGKTRVVCNPRGYPVSKWDFENPNFQKQLLIEI